MTEFVRRALVVLGLAALAFIVWHISYALLLGFGAVVFAVFLRGSAGKLAQWTGVGVRLSVGIVLLTLVGLIALAAALVGPSIAGQFDQLSATLVKGVEQVRGYLEGSAWGQPILDAVSSAGQDGGMVSMAGRALIGAVDGLLGLLLVLVAGAYLALSPRTYIEGMVYLFPKNRHTRAREVLQATGRALWLWVLGQFVIMVAVGVLTGLGLMLAGVPLALALGVLAGLLEFIPFLGPILAALPVILVALTAGPMTAVYAMLVLIVIQQLEGNLLTPLVERRAVSLPPVLILIGTIALSLLFGVLGLIFAAPLLVVIMVWTKMLYMEGVLAERVDVPGKKP